VAGTLCSAAWLSSVSCIVTGEGCGSCSGQVPRPNTILVQPLSVQMLSIGLRRVLRPDPLAIHRAYNPAQPDTSGNTRISVLWRRKATIAPWAVEGREAAGSLGRSPTAQSSNGGGQKRNAKAAGAAGPRASQGREVRGRDRRTCHRYCWEAGRQRPMTNPEPRRPARNSSSLLGSARRASNGVTLVFYDPSDRSVVPSRRGQRRRGFSAEGLARIGRVRDGLQLR
jgi:hypothetical protein